MRIKKRLKKYVLITTIIIIGIYAFWMTDPNLKIFDAIFGGEEVIVDYVTRVHDGDTIRTQNISEPIRILHIDAPEVPPTRRDYYGIEARDFLRDKILNKKVKLKCKGRDKYNRHLCEIYPEDADIKCIKNSYNYLMVKKGYACPFMTESNEIKNAGREARDKKIGIFSENSTYKCREAF